MSNNPLKKNSFTIIEVITAIFLLTIGVLGVYALIQATTAFLSLSSYKLVASYLTQEGLEIVRNIRDSNYLLQRINPNYSWKEGLTNCSTGCEADYDDLTLVPYADRFLKIDGNFYNYDSGIDTPFKRKIIILPQTDILEVSVEVSWQERGRTHKFVAQQHLYNWR